MRKLLFLFLLWPALCHAQGTQIVTVTAEPATCNTGMLYYNSTSNTLKSCGPNNTWTAPGGVFSKGVVDPTQTVYAGGAKANWIVTTDGTKFTITSGSAIVTCTTCNFSTTASVGMKVLATNWNGQDTSYTTATSVLTAVPTISSVDSNTQIHISSNATANAGTTNSNTGAFAYGTDDTAAIHAAKVAAFDGPICLPIQMPPGVTYMSAPEFNTAACVGFSGGSTSSKYPAVVGWGLGGPSTILVGPDFSACTTQCFGGAGGQWFNLTFNGLGNSSMNPFGTGVSFFSTENDGSYSNLSFWGIGGAATNLNCVTVNGGYHIFEVITIDGCGGGASAAALRVGVGQSAQTTFSGFIGNTTATLALVPATSVLVLRDWTYIMSAQTATGVGIDCGGTCIDTGGSFINSVNVASSVVQIRNGAIFDADHVSYQNNANSGSNVFSFFGSTSGTVKWRNARLLQGGSSGNIFGTTCSGCTIINDGPIGTISGTLFTSPVTASCAASFCGSTGSVSVGIPSTVERGNFTITAGGTGETASGTLTITFNQTYTINSSPICQVQVANFGNAWTAPVTSIIQSAATTSYVWTLTNASTALVAGNTYAGEWQCSVR